MPELTYKASYAKLAPRASMDTLVRLACINKAIPVEMLARPTVRARLQLPRKGSLDSHVSEVIVEPVGK